MRKLLCILSTVYIVIFRNYKAQKTSTYRIFNIKVYHPLSHKY